MFRRHRLAGFALLVPFALAFLVPGPATSDDTVLFSTAVPPNVLLLVDNSGSMHHIVWHPEFDPNVTPTCSAFSSTQYLTSNQINWTKCGKTINVYVDPNVSGSTRFDKRYLNWLFSPESNAYNAEIEAASNGTYSTCLGGGSYSLYRRSRITAEQDILREVICQVNAAGEVRFGLAQFRRGGDPEGGYVSVPIGDYLDGAGNPNSYTLDGVTQSHGDHLDDAIDDLTGEAWTPLAETMFQAYTYFMPRTTADLPKGKDGSTKFPKYSYRTVNNVSNGGPYTTTASQIPVDPVQWECQKNFVIVITDGEPTKDDFDTASPDDKGFSDFKNKLIGDYYVGGDEPETGYSSEGSRYLDDIAKFMNDNDFRPDLDGDQTIDTYTVGFTTNADANIVLSKTAQAGNGIFYTSNDAEQLSEDIVDAITDIVEKSQSFAAATVPASRTAEGGRFYTSSFIPSRADGHWTGHLKSWTITKAGEIEDKNGDCALDSPVVGQCFSGPFLPAAVPFWDAGDQIPAPASRKLETTIPFGVGNALKIPFNDANMTAAYLGVTAADIPSYDYPGAVPANAEELADLIADNARGCTFGTGTTADPCVTRPWLLGDIFHSAPAVVSKPSSFHPEASYKQFALNHATRDRVIMAGANDGFFRIFHAGDWVPTAVPPAYDAGTGVELAGFMPYASRQKIKEIARDDGSRDQYFTDGSPTVVDAWFYSSPTVNTKLSDGSEWKTVAMAGLRQGGNSYFALDVTDPSSPAYPAYLWEFPREDAAASITDYMGQTWSDPIITRIKVRVGAADNSGAGYERWVAIFGGGYDPTGDPNDHAAYDPNATAGRSITVLDLKSGKILARKKFDPAAPVGDPERDMAFAIAATPGVYDLDFDGFADVIYVGDLGGNMWKWVIKDIADDIVNGGTGNEDQVRSPVVDWEFKKFFTAPVYNDGSNSFYKSFYFPPSATFKSGKLWLAFGSGERNNLQFTGFASTDLENNRFYSMKDLDPLEKLVPVLPTLTEAGLTDVTGDSSCADVTGSSGFYFRGVDGEKFVTNSNIFFYYVFMASYVPNNSGNPCDGGGDGFLYAFKVYCGEGLFEDGAGNPEIKLDLAEGLPTDPQVSIGVESGGSRVIVTKGGGDGASDLEVDNYDTGFDPSKATGQAYWRELTQ